MGRVERDSGWSRKGQWVEQRGAVGRVERGSGWSRGGQQVEWQWVGVERGSR